MLRLRKGGDVALVDLRTNSETRHELQASGFDLDQGMVVEDQGRRYGGSDAVAYLGALSTPSDLFNRLNRFLLSRHSTAKALYPILRSGRWLLLFLLNCRMISDGHDPTYARRETFTTAFALFSVFHFFNYAFEYRRFPPGWDLVLILVVALAALFRPSSARILFALMLASTISTIVQAPSQSNHTIVRTAALLGYWLSFCIAMVRNGHVSRIFERFAPAGCGVLLVMYFFGIFHKINTDFLDHLTSCATALWREMPAPLSSLSGPAIDYAAIYGTFIVEGVIVLALITRRFRHVGVAAGIVFHLLLSLSSYAMYISFTMLALALHTLFLNESAAQTVLRSPVVSIVRRKLAEPIYKALVFGLLLWLAIFAFAGRYTFAALAVFPLILPFCWAVLHYGGHAGPYAAQRSTLAVGGVITLLFFINCSMPYFGLKTAQSVNMFANLRLEAGKSNHLIFSADRRPLPYLDEVAEVTDAGGDPELAWTLASGSGIIFYDLLARLEERPELRVSFVMNGERYVAVRGRDLSERMPMLHPRWVRKYFHFQPVSLRSPEPCGV
jgi:hypothetical protein